jgi:hypothetical protein
MNLYDIPDGGFIFFCQDSPQSPVWTSWTENENSDKIVAVVLAHESTSA